MSTVTMKDQAEIEAQYEELIDLVTTTFADTPDRVSQILAMYKAYEKTIKTAPASSKVNFHNAWEGGYLDHVLRVVQCARYMKKLYEVMDGWVDFTDEELIFVALHHDMGKLGVDPDAPHYIVEDDKWKQTNYLQMYKKNIDRQYMSMNDATIFVLHKYGVQMSQQEFIAIKLTDGLYDDANKSYLMEYGSGPFPMRSNLHKVMHMADYMACGVEKDSARREFQ